MGMLLRAPPAGRLAVALRRESEGGSSSAHRWHRWDCLVVCTLTLRCGAPVPRVHVQELTKRIAQRIEQTMAARASTDGGGLNMLTTEGAAGNTKPVGLKTSLGLGRSGSGSGGGSLLSKKKR